MQQRLRRGRSRAGAVHPPGGAGVGAVFLLALVAAGITLFFFRDQWLPGPAEEVVPEVSSLAALVEAYLESQGGMEAIASINSLRTSGRFYPGGEAEPVPFSIVKKRPQLIRTYFDFPLFSRVQSFDGERAWQLVQTKIEPGERYEWLSEPETRDLAQNALFDHILIRQYEDYSRLRFLGRRPFQGEEYYWVEVLSDNFQQEKLILLSPDKFRDVYHLQENPRTGVREVIQFQDFQPTRGLYLATDIASYTDNSLNWRIKIEKIEANIGVSDFFFQLPDEALEAGDN